MGCSGKVLCVVLTSFLWGFLVLSLANWDFKTRDILTVSSNESLRFLKTMETEKKSGLDHNLNFVSKRRVPNGPDPIHNRRVGSSKLPPA